MTKHDATLYIESLKWFFERSLSLQHRYPKDYLQQTPEFTVVMTSTLDSLIVEIEKLK